jgi:hypothetical protein
VGGARVCFVARRGCTGAAAGVVWAVWVSSGAYIPARAAEDCFGRSVLVLCQWAESAFGWEANTSHSSGRHPHFSHSHGSWELQESSVGAWEKI